MSTGERHEPTRSEIATPAAEVGVMPMDLTVRTKLSVMMFLQYFVWGAWFVSMGSYISKTLGFTDPQKGMIYATSPIGAMVAPFFVGMIADRFFATQRILTVMHLAGAALLLGLSLTTSYTVFLPLMILFFLCYMPTLPLTNALSFTHMSDPATQFPGIRVLGTIGWIAAGLLVGWMGIADSAQPFQLGAGAAVLMALFCLALPHTPPPNPGGKADVRMIFGLDALALLKQRPFAVFAVGSFLICMPLQFYYSFAETFLTDIGVQNVVGKMTYGQMSEIFFMLVMPFFFVRLGVKYMLLVGMAAWALRYWLFSIGNADDRMWMLYGGILLHGVCYDFFFVTGYIYVDKKAPRTIRASAQGLIAFITWGIGGFIGSNIAGRTGEYFRTSSGGHDWSGFWATPAIAALVVLVLFALSFYDRVNAQAPKTA
ncbi:MAG: nucleoside permease [Pirellulales bacterium]